MNISHVRKVATQAIVAAAITVQLGCLLFVPNTEWVIFAAMCVGIGSIMLLRPADREPKND